MLKYDDDGREYDDDPFGVEDEAYDPEVFRDPNEPVPFEFPGEWEPEENCENQDFSD